MWTRVVKSIRPDDESVLKVAVPAQAPVEDKEAKEVKMAKRPDEVCNTRCASASVLIREPQTVELVGWRCVPNHYAQRPRRVVHTPMGTQSHLLACLAAKPSS